MDDDVYDRLVRVGRDLQRRAEALDQSSDTRDTALLMHGMATMLEAIRSLGITTHRINGPDGLGRSGEE